MDMCNRNQDMASVKEAILIIRHALSEGEVGPVCDRALGNFCRKLTASCTPPRIDSTGIVLRGKADQSATGKIYPSFHNKSRQF